MPTHARYLALFLLALATLQADESLAHARRAQLLLGADTWSQLIRIQNRAGESRYPRVVHALVFEVAGLLWFYHAAEGTQSFSLHRGRLEAEKADFGPLLRDLEPGFTRWAAVPPADADAALTHAKSPGLRNGCFIESVTALRMRWLTGTAMANPQLLSYYVDTPGRRQGHTVLAYEARDGIEIVDSAQPGRVFHYPGLSATDALALARAFEGADVSKARTLALAPPPARALATGRSEALVPAMSSTATAAEM